MTSDQWRGVCRRFARSSGHKERQLHEALTQEVVPRALPAIEARERREQEEAARAEGRQRSSARVTAKELSRETERERALQAALLRQEAVRMRQLRAAEAAAKREEQERRARERQEALEEVRLLAAVARRGKANRRRWRGTCGGGCLVGRRRPPSAVLCPAGSPQPTVSPGTAGKTTASTTSGGEAAPGKGT